MTDAASFAAFSADRLLARGPLTDVLRVAWASVRRNEDVLIVDLETGRPRDFDFRGEAQEVVDRYAPDAAKRGPGRPKLGVVAREVTLLPRHWEWLNGQPGGASVALRRLVDEARKSDQSARRQAQTAIYGFISLMGGNRPGFEEASRALFAGDRAAFARHISDWPAAIREVALSISEAAFAPGGGAGV